jgi:hypothetical protein
MTVVNDLAGDAVRHNSCACHGEEGGDPLVAYHREAHELQHLKQERPCNGVESLGNVDFDQ